MTDNRNQSYSRDIAGSEKSSVKHRYILPLNAEIFGINTQHLKCPNSESIKCNTNKPDTYEICNVKINHVIEPFNERKI